MKALVTGASSGIGRDIAIYLSKLGYDIIAVARDGTKLEELKEEIQTKLEIIALDLEDPESCEQLYKTIKTKNIEVLINNAGFGDFGEFIETDLKKEISMINTNITALHVLTKLFLQDMYKKDSGFMPGPLMATYYSTKSYVVRLTRKYIYRTKKEKIKSKYKRIMSRSCKNKF